jgi:hypothetical protein
MSVEEGIDSDGFTDGEESVEGDHGERRGATIVYKDDAGTTEVGYVEDVSASGVLSKQKKKTSKTFRVTGSSLETVRAMVSYLNGDAELRGWSGLPKLWELWELGKRMEIRGLCSLCVSRAVDETAAGKTEEELMAALGVGRIPEWETECVWVYESTAKASFET